jgi:hypothetical protein
VLRQAQHERILFRANFQSSPEQITVAPKKTPFALSLSKGPASAGQCQLVPPALRQAQHERKIFNEAQQNAFLHATRWLNLATESSLIFWI